MSPFGRMRMMLVLWKRSTVSPEAVTAESRTGAQTQR
jgi:hypothetical protein